MPFSTGIMLRNLTYRHLFAALGSSVYIQLSVELNEIHRNAMGNKVSICRGTCINSFGQGSKIYISNEVHLARGVQMHTNPGSQIYIGDKVRMEYVSEINGIDMSN